MEIFVPVEVHGRTSGNLCDDCKFIFNTFSRSHDVYICQAPRNDYVTVILTLVNPDSDPIDVHVIRIGTNHVPYLDIEYVKQVVLHAIDIKEVPWKYGPWIVDLERRWRRE